MGIFCDNIILISQEPRDLIIHMRMHGLRKVTLPLAHAIYYSGDIDVLNSLVD